jgi:hypothetical protein
MLFCFDEQFQCAIFVQLSNQCYFFEKCFFGLARDLHGFTKNLNINHKSNHASVIVTLVLLEIFMNTFNVSFNLFLQQSGKNHTNHIRKASWFLSMCSFSIRL